MSGVKSVRKPTNAYDVLINMYMSSEVVTNAWPYEMVVSGEKRVKIIMAGT